MITFYDALQIAERYLKRRFGGGIALQIVVEATVTRAYGWVFIYQSADYLRTRDFRDAVVGNAPFLVRRADGQVIVFGTADSIESYLDEYEKRNWPNRMSNGSI